MAATAVAAGLRLHDLGTWSLWIDEAHTFRDATMPLGGENGFLRSDRALYPLTFLVLRGLLALRWIGTDEFSLRLPFALVGILTVPVLALCGRRLVGAWPAILAAWFLTLDPWHLYWSQNARGYVLTCCLAAVACNRAHAYAETLRTRDLWATMLAIAVAALSHPSGGMLAVGLLVFVLLRRHRELHLRFVLWFVVGAVVVGIAVPWVLLITFPEFAKAKAEPSLLHLLQTTAYYFRPLNLFAAAIGLVFAWRWLGRDRGLLLGCLAVVPFFVLFAIGGQVTKVTARYAICTLPVLTWLTALACTHIAALAAGPALRRRVRGFAFALPLPLLLVADRAQQGIDYYGTQHGQRARWREASDYVRAWAGDAPLRVLTVNEPTIIYYLRPEHWVMTAGDPNPSAAVFALLSWRFSGQDGERVLHEPGGGNHLRWHLAEAKRWRTPFAVMVTAPELEEVDREDGALRQELQREFRVALHLPCWVGPKDESVYVYVPKGE